MRCGLIYLRYGWVSTKTKVLAQNRRRVWQQAEILQNDDIVCLFGDVGEVLSGGLEGLVQGDDDWAVCTLLAASIAAKLEAHHLVQNANLGVLLCYLGDVCEGICDAPLGAVHDGAVAQHVRALSSNSLLGNLSGPETDRWRIVWSGGVVLLASGDVADASGHVLHEAHLAKSEEFLACYTQERFDFVLVWLIGHLANSLHLVKCASGEQSGRFGPSFPGSTYQSPASRSAKVS